MKVYRPAPPGLYPLLNEFRIGDYVYSPAVADYTSNTGTVLANSILTAYYPVPRKLKVDEIAIFITQAGAAGGKGRLGIYNSDGHAYPGALRLDAGEIPIDGVGCQKITIDEVLAPGTYFLALTVNAANMRTYYITRYLSPIRSATSCGSSYGGYDTFRAYGPLPDPHPAGGMSITSLWGVVLRIAATP